MTRSRLAGHMRRLLPQLLTGGRNINELLESVGSEMDGGDALITRLLQKQAITAEKDGRRSLYAPLLTRDEWIADQSESLLDRVFGGRVAPLVAHFAEHRKLSRKDLAELKQLIAEIDDAD